MLGCRCHNVLMFVDFMYSVLSMIIDIREQVQKLLEEKTAMLREMESFTDDQIEYAVAIMEMRAAECVGHSEAFDVSLYGLNTFISNDGSNCSEFIKINQSFQETGIFDGDLAASTEQLRRKVMASFDTELLKIAPVQGVDQLPGSHLH